MPPWPNRCGSNHDLDLTPLPRAVEAVTVFTGPGSITRLHAAGSQSHVLEVRTDPLAVEDHEVAIRLAADEHEPPAEFGGLIGGIDTVGLAQVLAVPEDGCQMPVADDDGGTGMKALDADVGGPSKFAVATT